MLTFCFLDYTDRNVNDLAFPSSFCWVTEKI